MIIKGKSRAGPSSLAAHLGNTATNERVTLLEARGTVAQDLRGALIEMDAYAVGTRCEKSLYHANIDPQPPYRLTPEQRMEAVDALEERLGLVGHQRVVVMHEKYGREHLHVVWTRIDLDHMKSISDSHNYRKHEEVARDLERRFGHARVQGAHAERDGVERPDRTPSRAELRQEERTGIKGKDVKAEVTAALHAVDNAVAFRAALDDAGYVLAKGDRRDFVIVDREGGIHSLARRIDGMKAAELRAFMAPIDRESLPDTAQAREIAEERKRHIEDSHDQALLEKGYSRSDDYVSQTQAAQRDFRQRQEALNESPTPQRPTDQNNVEDRIARLLDDGERDSRQNAEYAGQKMNDDPNFDELSREALEHDPWNAVYMRLPENADRKLLEEAHLAAEHCYEAATHRVNNPEWAGLSAFEPRLSGYGRSGYAFEHAKAAQERLEELERLDPTLERTGPHRAAGQSEDEERIARIIEDTDRDRHRDAERDAASTEQKDKDGISDKFADTEMTEAQQQRMSRMLDQEGTERTRSTERDDVEPDRQHKASGGGRTRSQ